MSKRNEHIKKNLGLVYSVVKRYAKNNEEKEELTSVGTIGLIKATDTYDSQKGVLFATYAIKCIENEIKGELRKQKHVYLISLDKNPVPMDLLAYEESYEAFEEKADLYEAISLLSDADQYLIKLRYGLGSYAETFYTQENAAKLMGISQATFSRNEKRILRELRQNMAITRGKFV